ncbi:MAG: hydroxymethylglutaryl-CoA lyase [Thermodesulfobacteriota bacterium]
MSFPSNVTVVEVGPRDGFQMEREFIPTKTKIDIINSLAECGIKRMEVTSFVSPKAIPQMRDAAEVMAGVERGRGVHMIGLVPNPKGAEKAVLAGVDEMLIFVSASESHNRSNVNRTIDESITGFEDVVKIASGAKIPVRAGIAVSFGCPFEGEVPPQRVGRIVERLLNLGVEGVTLGDTTGMATPPIVRRTCEYLLGRFPGLEIALHFHNTRGIGLVNVYEALQMGLTTFESAVAGLGGCPFAPGATGNICTEDLVYLLHELGMETGIDLDALIRLARRVEELIGRPLPGQVMKAGKRLDLHPFPGRG